jgi:hypothetical protein
MSHSGKAYRLTELFVVLAFSSRPGEGYSLGSYTLHDLHAARDGTLHDFNADAKRLADANVIKEIPFYRSHESYLLWYDGMPLVFVKMLDDHVELHHVMDLLVSRRLSDRQESPSRYRDILAERFNVAPASITTITSTDGVFYKSPLGSRTSPQLHLAIHPVARPPVDPVISTAMPLDAEEKADLRLALVTISGLMSVLENLEREDGDYAVPSMEDVREYTLARAFVERMKAKHGIKL